MHQTNNSIDADAFAQALREHPEAKAVLMQHSESSTGVLHDVEGLEHEEIASILRCHVGTSKSQLHKALARLREILAADGITVEALQNG